MILTLPFVKEVDPNMCGGRYIDLWAVQPTGNWSADTAMGRDFADQALRVIRETEAYGLITQIAKAAANSHNGVRVGFTQILAERAAR